MDIPVGRLITIDMGDNKWGKVIYMVINPPIVCETCCSVISEWKSGEVICPECENIITHRDYYPCPKCGEIDYMSLRVVNNNNWQYDSVSGEVIEYNDKAGFVINICKKELEKEISFHKVKLLSNKETVDVKRKILWTNSDDYEAGKPIPDWIKEKIPDVC